MPDDFREEMAERVPWLRPVDYDILEWLSRHDDVEEGFRVTPSTISANLDYHSRYISERTKKLAKAGFLYRLDGPKYRLTDLGRKLLDSNLSEDDVPPEPSPDSE
ncbi:helix-turn-helix domain-containing protein [Halobacterium hubeiense]|nr:hypothetical protein [Halobacterium hubeiense]